MPYFACYNRGRYSTICAETKEDVVPTSFDFRIASIDFNTYAECEDFCRALNIHLKGNYDDVEETSLSDEN